MITSELERRKAICRDCPQLRTRNLSVTWCATRQIKPGGKVICLPWAASEYRKMLMDEKPNGGCPKWHEEMSKPETFPPLPENPQDGVLILSTGSQRRQWLWNAIASVRRHRPDLGIHVLSDVPVDVPSTWVCAKTGHASRYYKTQMHRLSPFPGITLFMDDDTVMHKPMPDFGAILGGADLAMAQEAQCRTIAHLCKESPRNGWTLRVEREATAEVCPPDMPHYNSGVLLFSRSPAAMDALDAWHEEWLRFRHVDQPSLCRALHRSSAAINLLDSKLFNCRTDWHNRHQADPYVFHFRIKGHENWYHENHQPAAAKHAAYCAFSTAVNHGQWTREQYEAAGKLIYAAAPMRLLVWGCRHDSAFWQAINRGGRTLFVEHDRQWAERARRAGCDVITATLPTRRGIGATETPRPAGLREFWDAVVIDAPPGYSADSPGRELPIRWAAGSGAGLIAVHDYDREWERACCDRYLGPPRHIQSGRGQLGIWSDNAISAELLR